MSPGNIMVLYDGNVKIVDFGIAKARGRLTQSGARQLKGKLGYASPEQLLAEPVDRRSDVYSLGVVLWEALAHRRLFPGEEITAVVDRRTVTIAAPSTLSPQVPPQIDEICLRALAADRADRFQTAAEMKEALEDVLRAIGAHRETEAIAAYMQQAFAGRRHERSGLLSRRATSTSGIVGAITGPASAVPRAIRTSEISGQVMSPQSATWVPRRAGRALAMLASLLAVGGAAAGVWRMVAPSRLEAVTAPAAAATPALERDTVAPAFAPAAAPSALAPAERSEPPAALARPTPRVARTASELYDEGAALFVKGKAVAAKERFKRAIAANPRHAPSHRGLGLVYQVAGRRDKAIASFEAYLRLSPGAGYTAAIRARIGRLKQ